MVVKCTVVVETGTMWENSTFYGNMTSSTLRDSDISKIPSRPNGIKNAITVEQKFHDEIFTLLSPI